MQHIDVTQVQTNLLNLLEQASKGEEIIIIKNNQPFVKFVSVMQPYPKYGSAKGLIKIADNFDEPLEEFREYM